jgi:hypothetical protein
MGHCGRSNGNYAEAVSIGATPHKRLSGWWVLITLSVGFAVAVAVGQFTTDGTAEIAGIMAGTSLMNARAFWGFKVKPWYLPLVAAWVSIHALVLVLFVVPIHLHMSKGYFLLVWAEFVLFVGLVFVASRLLGGLPDEA